MTWLLILSSVALGTLPGYALCRWLTWQTVSELRQTNLALLLMLIEERREAGGDATILE